jgi:iron complex transport system substrate-binding protein
MAGPAHRPASFRRQFLAGIVFALFLPGAAAGPVATDDTGREIALNAPARRIISLAPHVTELLFAAGAGPHVVGVARWSDFPGAARHIPLIGDTYSLDLERIVALEPDLVVAWLSGNGAARVDSLRNLGLTVFVSEPRTLEAIPDSIEALGRLAGTDEAARAEAQRFRERLATLSANRPAGEPLRVFYQVWHEPTFTVGGEHVISRIIERCGGRNVFAHLGGLSPRVDVEAVLAADPQVIVGSGTDDARPEWLDAWSAWPSLSAVRAGQVHHIPPDLIQRHTPRILDGMERMCRILDAARSR